MKAVLGRSEEMAWYRSVYENCKPDGIDFDDYLSVTLRLHESGNDFFIPNIRILYGKLAKCCLELGEANLYQSWQIRHFLTDLKDEIMVWQSPDLPPMALRSEMARYGRWPLDSSRCWDRSPAGVLRPPTT